MLIPLLTAIALVDAAGAAGQTPVPLVAGASLFTLDLAGTPPGEFPAGIRQLQGSMEVVLKDGVPMLKASAASEFLITLPQALPPDFTLEFDIVPKSCCNPQDLSFEGTPTINQGSGSAHVLWDSDGYLAIIGGGGTTYESPMPEELRATLPGVLTQVVAVVQGTTVRLYTNGRRHYTLDKRFARGRVLRVFLGGQDAGDQAVYLAGLRVLAGAAPPTGAVAITPPGPPPGLPTIEQSQAASGGSHRVVPNVAVAQGAGGPVVTWGTLGGGASYAVKRWKLDDVNCCANASPKLSGPPWQDTPLPVAGTYVYEVTASTPGWIATGQARFIQLRTAGQIATVAPPSDPATVSPPTAEASGPLAPRTSAGTVAGSEAVNLIVPRPKALSLEGFATPVPPPAVTLKRAVQLEGFATPPQTPASPITRTFTLGAFAAATTTVTMDPGTNAIVGLPGSSVSTGAPPRTLTLQGFTVEAKPLSNPVIKTVPLVGFAVLAPLPVPVLRRSIPLTGFTSVSP